MVSLPGLPALPAAQFYCSLEYAGELLVRKMSGLLSANCCRIVTMTRYIGLAAAGAHVQADPLDKQHGWDTILRFVGMRIYDVGEHDSWSRSPFQRSSAMDTPPCS